MRHQGLGAGQAFFPAGSAGKESACRAGDPGSILVSGSSPEEGQATHLRILVWRIPVDRGAWRAAARGVAKSWTCLSTQHGHVTVGCWGGT